jgi:dTMP kinase
MNAIGQLFVFEGNDAAGKSSISARFVDWLRSHGKTVESMSFPGKSPGTIGELVYQIHDNRADYKIESLTELSLQALHVAAHLDVIESQIIPSLEAGKIVVLDRYWWSTKVYGLAGGAQEKILDKLIEAEQLLWGDWLPTSLFLICRDTPLREEPKESWTRCQEGYGKMLRQELGRYPIHAVKNEGGIDDCLSEIIRHCAPFI